jgi:hypothetical protein
VPDTIGVKTNEHCTRRRDILCEVVALSGKLTCVPTLSNHHIDVNIILDEPMQPCCDEIGDFAHRRDAHGLPHAPEYSNRRPSITAMLSKLSHQRQKAIFLPYVILISQGCSPMNYTAQNDPSFQASSTPSHAPGTVQRLEPSFFSPHLFIYF